MRTHTCEELRAKNCGENVILQGWVSAIRDHGRTVFLSLRDRYGITQIVFTDDKGSLLQKAKELGGEYVVEIEGPVRERPDGMKNPNLTTGDIEVLASRLKVLSPSLTPPFEVQDPVMAKDELRMRYRYLDLRRPSMQKKLLLRAKLINSIRTYLSENNFLEIETPYLTRTTTEGARNFIVPSRNFLGKFFSLAQSPQIYKQLLMVAGVDRYFQFARCFRDEDQRSDRQPEHTQIDLEMSFVDEDDVMEVVEGMLQTLFQNILDIKIKIPFERLRWNDAMERYGSDKPDIRFGIPISDVTDIAKESVFRIFKDADFIKTITLPLLTRNRIDKLSEFAQSHYGSKISYISFKETLSGGLAKFFPKELIKKLRTTLSITDESTVLFCAGEWKKILVTLGAIRSKMLEEESPKEQYRPLWVTDFPLFEWNEETKSFLPCHHIFTMPKTDKFDDPSRILGKQYDLVLNGVELGSGSIRNHKRELQEKMMEMGGMDKEKREREFGFFLSALEYGAPPHGGIAIGLERLLMILSGENSIQEVIPFPKTLTGAGIMESVPSEIDAEKLKELGLST